MRISDRSSDVCSSDLHVQAREIQPQAGRLRASRHLEIVLEVGIAEIPGEEGPGQVGAVAVPEQQVEGRRRLAFQDRKSVVQGKSVSVRVDLGGRRIIKKHTTYHEQP